MRFYLTTSLILLVLCSSLVFAADKMILIGKNAPINNNDLILMQHLQGLGLEVEYHSEPEGHPVDLKGAVGIFISESVTSGNIGPVYNDVDIPVIISKTMKSHDLVAAPGLADIMAADRWAREKAADLVSP